VVGRTLSHFSIKGELGRGGMGVGYRAHDLRLDRDVALKVLPPDLIADDERRRRLLQEARAAAGLSDPHIAVVHEVDEVEGTAFIAMELVDGESLAVRLARERLPLATCLDMAAQVADGLVAAHAHGIVHRDLKPANILVDARGQVKIIDFGLAKLRAGDAALTEDQATGTAGTLPGVVLGTLSYMSPEQLQAKPVDARSDLFSLGVVLYEMLSGRPAFQRDSAAASMTAILRDDPLPLADCPPLVRAIVDRCLRKLPAERYGSAAELRQALVEAAAEPARQDRRPSIAVLPFANLGASPDTAYFSDGLAEEVINALAQLPSLRVIARTSAFAVGSRGADVREVGRALDVEHVLEGSVRMAGSRVRVTAQLVSTRDGSHLWSERYDRELTDVFAIQDEIAGAIADRLRAGIGRVQGRGRKATGNAEAYNRYLLGRHHFYKGTPEGYAAARHFFEQAIALDPGFAVAHEALSELWWFVGFLGLVAPKEAFTTGLLSALRAIELDETLAETHAMLAMFRKELEYNWAEVHREFARALELDPSSPRVRFRHALSELMPSGRMPEAIAVIEALLKTDPLSFFMRSWLAVFHGFARDHQRAVAESRRALEIEPDHPQSLFALAVNLSDLGRHDEGCEAQRRCVAVTGASAWAIGILGWLEARAGHPAEATRILDDLIARAARGYVPPTRPAFVCLGLGRTDAAMEWLDRAVDERDPFVIPIKVWSMYDPIRAHPGTTACC
jgi:serine/threonine-protein kinase